MLELRLQGTELRRSAHMTQDDLHCWELGCQGQVAGGRYLQAARLAAQLSNQVREQPGWARGLQALTPGPDPPGDS